MEEGGVSGVNQTAWQGVFSAPRMPQPLRERIAREVFAITSDPAYQQKLRQSGFETTSARRCGDRAYVP